MNFRQRKSFGNVLLCAFAGLMLLSGCASYHMRQGNRLYSLMAYTSAVKEYEKALDSRHKRDAQRQLAAAYLKMNNIEKARSYYGAIVNDTAVKATAAERQQYADLLMRSGMYELATMVLQKQTDLDARGRMLLISCDSVQEWRMDSLRYDIRKSNVNSGGESNFSPTYYKDGIVFVSDRGKMNSRTVYEWTGRPFLDAYFAKTDKDGNLGSAEKIQGDINGIYHEGPMAINAKGDTLYLTRNNYVKKKVGKSSEQVVNFKIYQLYKKDTLWTGLKELSFNSSEFNCGHPALSGDGNTMYFSSDRPGGSGGSDLYVTTKVNGVWSDPKNLGTTVNTAGNESFPYLWNDSIFYFSSDGGYGLGGLDIYRCEMVNGQPSAPTNAGYPFNTNFDDFGIAINKLGTEGYLSSNRDSKNTEIDQIYQVTFNDVRFTLQGIAINKRTQLPVEGVVVELKNVTTGRKETVITGPDGKFKFKLNPRSDYTVSGSKDGYFTNTEEVTTVGKTKSEDMYVKLKLELEEIVVNKPIVLENIYYDLDKWDIRPDAAAGLDVLVQIMKETPAIRIELGSHTDSRADDVYNDELSQKRAETAANYIVAHGISRDRITAKGYGERQLVNGCGNDVKCTEEEHQANRRTEFKVVSIDQTK